MKLEEVITHLEKLSDFDVLAPPNESWGLSSTPELLHKKVPKVSNDAGKKEEKPKKRGEHQSLMTKFGAQSITKITRSANWESIKTDLMSSSEAIDELHKRQSNTKNHRQESKLSAL